MKRMTRGMCWVWAAALVTAVLGVFYLAVQQSLRQSANEPQRSMVADAVDVIKQGKDAPLWGSENIDMALNMAPFMIVYDQAGNVVSGNGYLDGEIPKVPAGVLENAMERGENRVTWEPVADVRVAAVIQPAGDYFVLGGRSLLKVESWIMAFSEIMLVAWGVSMIAMLVGYRMDKQA